MDVNDRAILEALITSIELIERQPKPISLAGSGHARSDEETPLKDHISAQSVQNPTNNTFLAGIKYQATTLVDRTSTKVN
jgi:hypothetical protein